VPHRPAPAGQGRRRTGRQAALRPRLEARPPGRRHRPEWRRPPRTDRRVRPPPCQAGRSLPSPGSRGGLFARARPEEFP